MTTIIYFIVGLGLLIFIHELGHFLVAKFHGIRVERFSLGFGPRIIKYKWGETEYCISALPLGGYVKMTGQEDFGEEKEISPLDDPKAFNSKSIGARLSVVLAGPVMNLLLPFLLLPLAFMAGIWEPIFYQEAPIIQNVQAQTPAAMADLKTGDQIIAVEGHPVSNWRQVMLRLPKVEQYEHPQTFQVEVSRQDQSIKKQLKIGAVEKCEKIPPLGIEPQLFYSPNNTVEVFPSTAAEQGGLKTGDKVLALNGQRVTEWDDIEKHIKNSEGKEIIFDIERQGEKQSFSVKPLERKCQKEDGTVKKDYWVGIGVYFEANPDIYHKYSYNLAQSISLGFKSNLRLYEATFQVLKSLFSFELSYKELGGFIRIAQVSEQTAKKGMGDFLSLLAFLSIQLGILNLLPIPVLDGGHAVFLLYEAVVRRPLNPKTKLVFQQIGMAFLLGLILLVTFNDVVSIWGRGIAEWFRGLVG